MYSPQTPPPLEEEIATLRANIRHVADALAAADDPTRHAHALARLSDSLIKALRAQQAFAPDPHDELQATIDRVFFERGLGPIDPYESEIPNCYDEEGLRT